MKEGLLFTQMGNYCFPAKKNAKRLLRMVVRSKYFYINNDCESAYKDASSTTHFQQFSLFIYFVLSL